MFSVYKITNNKNNKCYIGSSIYPEKRWQQHKNSAFNPNYHSYNYPLQRAFRKYGIENFTFEILKDDFSSRLEMENYEQSAILYYKSHKLGYNQTLNTHLSDICRENADKYIAKISCRCAKIDKNNNILEKYSSYHEAARKNGLDGDVNAGKIRAVCRGERSSIYGTLFFRDLDENDKIIEQSFKSYKNRKTLIGIDVNNPENIRYFSSISEAAKELNTDRQSIGQCIQGKDRYSIIKGYILREIDSNGDIIETQKTIEERLKEYNEINPVINGERHSITEWCAILGISRHTYYYRKKQWKSTLEALLLPKKR